MTMALQIEVARLGRELKALAEKVREIEAHLPPPVAYAVVRHGTSRWFDVHGPGGLVNANPLGKPEAVELAARLNAGGDAEPEAA